MQLPIVAPAPVVTAHADIFRDLFENRCQFRHFQNYLTGLIVLDNKSLANITRCVLESADKTNLSRFFSEAPWFQEQVNDRRVAYLHQQTKEVRVSKADAALILDDTLCEHVGSLFAMWTAIIIMATPRIPSRTIPSPVIMSVAPSVFLWISVYIGAMKN